MKEVLEQVPVFVEELEPTKYWGVFYLDVRDWSGAGEWIYATPVQALALAWAMAPCDCGKEHPVEVRQAPLAEFLQAALVQGSLGVSLEVAPGDWDDIPL